MAFVTPIEAQQLTGNGTITDTDITKAQSVIEAYVGKQETRITDVDDLELLKLATAWQAVFMQQNPMVMHFPDVTRAEAPNFVLSMRGGAAQIAGISKLACRGLSWRRSRSISTGKIDVDQA